MNSLTEHCETGLAITLWKHSGSDWAPVCQICCSHVDESHLVSLSCWGQAVVWRSWDTKWCSIWFMKFLSKLEKLSDLERMGWFRKYNANTKSSKKTLPPRLLWRLCQSDSVTRKTNPTMPHLHFYWHTEPANNSSSEQNDKRGKAMLGYNAVCKLKRREKSCGDWIGFERLFALRDTWWGNRKYGTKATKKRFGLPCNTWTDGNILGSKMNILGSKQLEPLSHCWKVFTQALLHQQEVRQATLSYTFYYGIYTL